MDENGQAKKPPPLRHSCHSTDRSCKRLWTSERAGTAAAWLPGRVSWGMAEHRMKASPSPCHSQLPDPLTSFSWHTAVPSPLHTQERKQGLPTSHKTFGNVPQHLQPALTLLQGSRQNQPRRQSLPLVPSAIQLSNLITLIFLKVANSVG